MKIEIACSCGKEYSVGPELLGEQVKCKACGKMIDVEIGMAAAPPEPDPVEEPKKAVKAPKSKKGTGRTARKGKAAGSKKAGTKKASSKKGTGSTKRATGAGGKKASKGKKATGGARRPPPPKKGKSPAVLLALVAGVGALVLGGVYLVVGGGSQPAVADGGDAEAPGESGSGTSSTTPKGGADAKPKNPDGWENYRPDDGGFDVLLPGTPSHRIDSFDTPAATGGSLKRYVTEVVTDGGKVSYVASYMDYPLNVPAHETFQEVEAHILRGVPEPRQNLTQGDRKHSQGSPGRELRVTAEFSGTTKSVVTYLYLVKKKRVIQLTVTSEQGAGSLPNSSRFLDSLQIFEWDD